MNVFFDAAKLRQHRQEQAAHGFPLLRACPNTAAIARITFLDTLAPAEREDFANQLSCLEDEQASRPPPTNADFQEMVRAFPLLVGFFGRSIGLHPPQATALDIRQVPVKLMAKLLAEAGAGGLEAIGKTLTLSDEPEARRPSSAHAASLDEAVPVAPARLRKLIGRMMSDRFGATAQAIDKQHTVYDALVPAGQLRLHAMFAPPRPHDQTAPVPHRDPRHGPWVCRLRDRLPDPKRLGLPHREQCRSVYRPPRHTDRRLPHAPLKHSLPAGGFL